jgi:plasmid maintenance system antidote protein VapI
VGSERKPGTLQREVRKKGMTDMKNYNSDNLLDLAKRKLGVDSDYALALQLGVNRSVISRIRTGNRRISAKTIVKIQGITGLTMEDIKRVTNDTRRVFRSQPKRYRDRAMSPAPNPSKATNHIARLFDFVRLKLSLRSNKELANILETDVSVLSHMRTGFRPLSANVIVKIQETTGLSLEGINGILTGKMLPPALPAKKRA